MSAPSLPKWADIVLLPLVNLAMALVRRGYKTGLLDVSIEPTPLTPSDGLGPVA